MRLSTRSRYGVRLMVELACEYGKGPVLLSKIAKRQDISAKYLSNIIIPLKSAGLVNSQRGAHGGYSLACQPNQITLKEVVEILEGDLVIVDCTNNPRSCSRIAICPARSVWVEVKEKIDSVLSGVTLADLAAKMKDKKSTMYNI